MGFFCIVKSLYLDIYSEMEPRCTWHTKVCSLSEHNVQRKRMRRARYGLLQDSFLYNRHKTVFSPSFFFILKMLQSSAGTNGHADGRMRLVQVGDLQRNILRCFIREQVMGYHT